MRLVGLLVSLLLAACASAGTVGNQMAEARDQPVEIASDAWQLKGDFRRGVGFGRRPAVLLLNKANGNRQGYAGLASELALRGMSSLRLDLRAHGESVNKGRFVPSAEGSVALLDGSEADVAAALAWLRAREDVDRERIAVVGASYSAEVATDAARRQGRFAQAYAMLSPGSLSEESARGIDGSGARWLVVRAARERSPSVKAAADRVAIFSRTAELRVLDSDKHATDMLESVPELSPWLAYWLQQSLAR